MSSSLELSYLARLALETVAFGAVMVLGIALRQRGRWAVLAAVGGSLGTAVELVNLVTFVEVTYLETSALWSFLVGHGEGVHELLAWGYVAAVVLVAVALGLCAQAAATSTDSTGDEVLTGRRRPGGAPQEGT